MKPAAKASLFGDDGDDPFGAVTKKAPAPPAVPAAAPAVKPAAKASLFGDDDDNDLFGSSTSSASKINKAKPSSNKSLFDD